MRPVPRLHSFPLRSPRSPPGVPESCLVGSADGVPWWSLSISSSWPGYRGIVRWQGCCGHLLRWSGSVSVGRMVRRRQRLLGGPTSPLRITDRTSVRPSQDQGCIQSDRRDLMSQSIEELALRYHQAWVTLDPNVIVAMHSEDSVFHMHGAAEPAVGRHVYASSLRNSRQMSLSRRSL